MVNYHLSNKYKYNSKTATKGVQPKYYKDGWYYKLGTHEAICEDLVTRLLLRSTLGTNCYVKYEKCKVNGIYACRSYSFLSKDEVFVTISSLYKIFTGKENLSDYLLILGSSVERLNYLLNLVNKSTGISNYNVYLKTMLLLDMLILNNDRHVHNYGVIYNKVTGKYRIPPIFDNGNSLKPGMSSCTISGSFEDQVVAFGFPVSSTFKIHYADLYKSLSHYTKCNEVEVLKNQLERYKNIFNG